MKGIILFIVLLLFCKTITAQKVVYRISEETEMMWDVKTQKQISTKGPFERKFLIVHDRGADSILFVDVNSKVGYPIIPSSLKRDAEWNKIGFIVDNGGGKYTDVTIRFRTGDWLINHDLNLLDDATIFMSECDKAGNEKPGKDGLYILLYKIDNVIIAK